MSSYRSDDRAPARSTATLPKSRGPRRPRPARRHRADTALDNQQRGSEAANAPMGTGTAGTTWQAGARTVDVVIMTAIRLEFDAVLKVDEGAVPGTTWEVEAGPSGLPVAFRSFVGRGERPLRVAMAVAPAMGATATVNTLLPLVEALRPRCIAMCGVCAGRRGKTRLGGRDRGGPALLPRHGQATAGRGAAGSDDVQPARRLEGCARGAGCGGGTSEKRPRRRRRAILTSKIQGAREGGISCDLNTRTVRFKCIGTSVFTDHPDAREMGATHWPLPRRAMQMT